MGGSNRARAVYVLVFVLATVLGFYPVLSGSFYFDDFGNLPALGEYGPVNDWAALARYLTAGIADPLGRPVAMASFLIGLRMRSRFFARTCCFMSSMACCYSPS